MTMLRFSGGEVIKVNLSIQDVSELLTKALANNTLLELEASDGEVIVINPQQVQVVSRADVEQANGRPSSTRVPV